MQEQGVAQVHLFRSWHRSTEGLERTAGSAAEIERPNAAVEEMLKLAAG
jgi:hypothetical protein